VTFAYNQEDVIKDVSCKIPQGSVTALVGPSGSGKSTISKLIARFWDVQQGKITVGGKDIKSMEPESLMSYMVKMQNNDFVIVAVLNFYFLNCSH